MRTPCLELLGQLELERISIRTIPTIWTFDDDAHGVVHPWRFSDKGTIRRDAQTATLLWSTIIDSEGDALVIGFDDPSPAPTEIFFTASARFEAHLGVEAEDNMGHRYRLPRDLRVDQARTRFTVALDKLLPLDQTAPLVPRELSRVRLLEVSGSHGASGSNALTPDDVGAR